MAVSKETKTKKGFLSRSLGNPSGKKCPKTLFLGFSGYGQFLECSAGRNPEEIRQE
jgi:hypothetical protein